MELPECLLRFLITPIFVFQLSISPFSRTLFSMRLHTAAWGLLVGIITGVVTPFSVLAFTAEFPLGSLDTLRSEVDEDIPDELSRFVCGGYDTSLRVQPYLARVQEVPGRESDWADDRGSGMAVRRDEFLFPDTAHGLATACNPGIDEVPVFVWSDDDEDFIEEIVDYPYFEDPACHFGDTNGGSDLSPESCRDFCAWVNEFRYRDCVGGFEEVEDPDDPEETITRCVEDGWGDRFTCTGLPVPDDLNIAELCDEFANPPNREVNARPCTGQECRCSLEDDDRCLNVEESDTPYLPYYRRYDEARYDRDRLNLANDDQNAKDLDIACFGFYDEFDTLERQTEGKDRRCVISIDIEGMENTQNAVGSVGDAGFGTDLPHRREDFPLDDTSDWVSFIGSAFSLPRTTNTSTFAALSALPPFDALQVTSLTVGNGNEKRSRVAPMDDTGGLRTITQWDNAVQEDVRQYLRAPQVTLILPASEEFSAAEEDTSVPRARRIAVQAREVDDVLGEALSLLRDSSLLQLEEERIAVLLPSASPLQLRSTSEAWCQWYLEQHSDTDTCDGTPVEELVTSLDEYAENIEQVRLLRSTLATTLVPLLALQVDIDGAIDRWATQVKDQVAEYDEFYERSVDFLAPRFAEWQTLSHEFSMRDNQPWCMNQRYTTPVYSLLDPWLPGRSDEGSLYAYGADPGAPGLPELPEPPIPTDMLIDLSHIRLSKRSVLTIPVLDPQTVDLRIPLPNASTTEADIPELPVLPPVDPVIAAIEDALSDLPTLTVDEPEAFDLPSPADIAVVGDAAIALDDSLEILRERNASYRRFWESLNDDPVRCDNWGDSRCAHVEMDLMERIQRIGSRPGVHLADDLLNPLVFDAEPTLCNLEQGACDPLAMMYEPPVLRWDARSTWSSETDIGDIRRRLADATLADPLGSLREEDVPPYARPMSLLLRTLQATVSNSLVPPLP